MTHKKGISSLNKKTRSLLAGGIIILCVAATLGGIWVYTSRFLKTAVSHKAAICPIKNVDMEEGTLIDFSRREEMNKSLTSPITMPEEAQPQESKSDFHSDRAAALVKLQQDFFYCRLTNHSHEKISKFLKEEEKDNFQKIWQSYAQHKFVTSLQLKQQFENILFLLKMPKQKTNWISRILYNIRGHFAHINIKESNDSLSIIYRALYEENYGAIIHEWTHSYLSELNHPAIQEWFDSVRSYYHFQKWLNDQICEGTTL